MQSSLTPLRLTRRAFLVRGLATAAAAATLAVPTAALPTATRAAPSRQQLPTLVMALDQSDVRTLDPAREFEFAAAFIDLNCYDTLVQYNQDDFTRFEPALAKEWTISPDGTEYTFKLRDDVKFASGNPLTAEDVVFSINRWKNIKGNPAWMTDPMAEIKALDQYTVVTRLKEPFADWLAVLSGPNAGIVDMKLATEHGAAAAEDADKSDTAEEWFNQNSAGSGPFILRGWEKNNVIRLEANPNYWRGAPRIGAVEVRDVPSPAAQKLQLESGDIDVAMNLTPDVAESVKGNPDIKIVVGQSMDNMYIGLTTNPEFSEPLSKKEVRQAIRAAVDYDGILALTNNMAIRGPVVWPIGYLGLETQEIADQFNPQRDLAKAKELLTQAGYPNGFSFKLEYGTGPSPVGITYESVAQKFQADLAEVGITVELVPEEFSVMLTNYRAKKAVAVISYNAPDYLGPSDMSGQMVLHTWAPRLYYDKTQSPQASELARKGDQATDPEERRKYYHELIRLLLDEGPYVNVVQGKVQIAMRQNIDGYRYFPIGYVRLLPITKS